MKKVLFFGIVSGVAAAAGACDGRTCDRVARIPCDNAASVCQTEKCADDEDGLCFEQQCQPTLCECLDEVGCAWESTFCDDLID